MSKLNDIIMNQIIPILIGKTEQGKIVWERETYDYEGSTNFIWKPSTSNSTVTICIFSEYISLSINGIDNTYDKDNEKLSALIMAIHNQEAKEKEDKQVEILNEFVNEISNWRKEIL